MKLSLPNLLQFIFNNCKNTTDISEEILADIEKALDLEKIPVKAYRKSGHTLNQFIKRYAKHCLAIDGLSPAAAQRKFLYDLFKNEYMLEYYKQQIPVYKVSDVILTSVASHSEISRLVLSLFIFQVNIQTMGLATSVTNNVALMASEVIDCSKLTKDPKINRWLETCLKELMPLAVYIAANIATTDGELLPVALYALIEYLCARGLQTSFDIVRQKIFGPQQFAQYALNQVVFGLSVIGFKTVFPENAWLSVSLLKNCMKSLDENTLKQYFNLTEFATSVNTTLLSQQFKNFARYGYKAGFPINETAANIVNGFYNCMRKDSYFKPF